MTVRLVFVGAGSVASVHLENAQLIDDAAVVVVCDTDERTATEVAESSEAAAFTDTKTMFSHVDIDAVIVAVPSFAHGEAEHLTAEYGVGLLVEKPLCLYSTAARRMRSKRRKHSRATISRYREIIRAGVLPSRPTA